MKEIVKASKRRWVKSAVVRMLPLALLFLLPVGLFAATTIDRPFSQVLVSKTVSLRGLSPAQKLNIHNVAQRLNHVVVPSDQEFSFYNLVGPRDEKHGYLPAPSYVGVFSGNSMGGGICLVSSMVYQDALRTGMDITQRTPHLRTTHSIAAGLDATVWYGGADLRFRNTLSSPIEITADCTASEVTITFLGRIPNKNWQLAELSCAQQSDLRNRLSVLVFAKQDGKTQLVSHDMYGMTNTGARNR